jgi:hypothetical protein
MQRPQVIDSGDELVLETTSPADFFVFFKANGAPVDMDSLRITAKKGLFSKSLTEPPATLHSGHESPGPRGDPSPGRFLIQIEIADQNGAKTDGHHLLRVQE